MDKYMLPIGTLLNGGRFKVIKHLSSGGFGKTYVVEKVFHKGELYAMKEFFIKGINARRGNTVIVSNEENEDTFESQKSKFLTEAERLRDIDNEHIVRVHDFFSDNETCYYIMDLIDGESLDAVKKPLKEEKVWDILNQVLDALSTIHQKKTIDNKKERIWLHLDIKPANLMIDKGGKVTLIDFGASKQLSANNNDLSLSMSQMSFTRGYAPIEQTSQNFDSIGPWTDFYALGATLYKLLTEKDSVIPEYSELAEILYSNDDIIKAFKFPKNISEKMRNLITWLMNPNRKKRPQSVEEIRNYMRQPQSSSRLSSESGTPSFGGIVHESNSPVLSREVPGLGKPAEDENTIFDQDVQSSTKKSENIIAIKSHKRAKENEEETMIETDKSCFSYNENTVIDFNNKKVQPIMSQSRRKSYVGVKSSPKGTPVLIGGKLFNSIITTKRGLLCKASYKLEQYDEDIPFITMISVAIFFLMRLVFPLLINIDHAPNHIMSFVDFNIYPLTLAMLFAYRKYKSGRPDLSAYLDVVTIGLILLFSALLFPIIEVRLLLPHFIKVNGDIAFVALIVSGCSLLFTVFWIWKKLIGRKGIKVSFLWITILILIIYIFNYVSYPLELLEFILIIFLPLIGGIFLMGLTNVITSIIIKEPKSASSLYLHYVFMVFSIIYYMISLEGH